MIALRAFGSRGCICFARLLKKRLSGRGIGAPQVTRVVGLQPLREHLLFQGCCGFPEEMLAEVSNSVMMCE